MSASSLSAEPAPKAALAELARRAGRDDLLAFCALMWPQFRTGPHHMLIADALERVERGECLRLCISMPPRHGKSLIASEHFPAWYLGRNPGKYVIASTYAQELADDFGRKVRNLMVTPEFRAVFPDCELAQDSQAAKRFHTTAGGVYFAVGAGGPVTGRGAHLLVLDDPIKGREDADSDTMRRKLKDWFTSVAYTRLMPGGAVVIVQTRWHEDDLTGWVTSEMQHDGWEVLSLPAITEDGRALWPEQFPVDALLRIKETLPTRDWSALYQQQPRPDEGGILKRAWWRQWKGDPPAAERILAKLMVADTAFSTKDSADFSAVTTWCVFRDDEGKPAILMLGAWKDRLEYPDLRRRVKEDYTKHEPDMLVIEAKASGQSLIQDLNRTGMTVVPYDPGTRDKVARAYGVSGILEAGRVYAPEKQWADEVIDECASFPTGKHDDYVDTVTMALHRFTVTAWVTHPDDEDDEPPPRKRSGSYY